MMKSLKPISAQLGVDMMSDETSLSQRTVRQAMNVDIDRDGNFGRRRGQTLIDGTYGYHSLYASAAVGFAVVALGAKLNKVRSLDPFLLTPLFDLHTADPLDFVEYNNSLYFSNASTIGWVPAGTSVARSIGVPKPSAPTVTLANGGLASGSYTFAVSIIDDRGEESPLSDYTRVESNQETGFQISNLPLIPGYKARLYATTANGELLFLTNEFDAVLSTVQVTSLTQRAAAGTQHLLPLPPGEIIRWHNGRLYTALGNELRWSEPLRPGLYDPRHNAMLFNGAISVVEPVEGGIFVGDSAGVWFLDGGDPEKFSQRLVSTHRAVRKSSTKITGDHISLFNGKGFQPMGVEKPVAVWLSTVGYVVGLPDGSTKELQDDRVRVPGGLTGRTFFAIRGGTKQLLTPVNSSSAAAYGIAANYSVTP